MSRRQGQGGSMLLGQQGQNAPAEGGSQLLAFLVSVLWFSFLLNEFFFLRVASEINKIFCLAGDKLR